MDKSQNAWFEFLDTTESLKDLPEAAYIRALKQKLLKALYREAAALQRNLELMTEIEHMRGKRLKRALDEGQVTRRIRSDLIDARATVSLAETRCRDLANLADCLRDTISWTEEASATDDVHGAPRESSDRGDAS